MFNDNEKVNIKFKSTLSVTKRIAELGKDIPLIQTAASAVKEILGQIELQVKNKEMWGEIKEKVCTAQKQLSHYAPDEEKYDQAYKNYIEVLNHIVLFIKETEETENKKKLNKNLRTVISFVKASHVEYLSHFIKNLDWFEPYFGVY